MTRVQLVGPLLGAYRGRMGIDPNTVPTWLLPVVLVLVIAVVGGLTLWVWRSRTRERWWRARTTPPTHEPRDTEIHTRHQWE